MCTVFWRLPVMVSREARPSITRSTTTYRTYDYYLGGCFPPNAE
jgi:hypothetical protein